MDELVKHREILFDALHPEAHQAGVAAGLLQGVEGICYLQAVSPLRLLVAYDVRAISLETIDRRLSEAGLHLDNSLLSKLKRSLCYYTEETLRANLGCEDGPSNCTRQVFVQRYRRLRHGCRDPRPEHWRQYL